jgi:starvation-inducible outer membrane lipoprotein
MNKAFLVLIGIFLTSCATVPATIKIQDNEILRGSASGSLGSDAVISVKNIDGLSCKGKMFVPVSSANTEGTIECNDKRKGNFIANGNAESWTGEGKLDDGTKFSIIIGPQKTTIKH